MPELRRFFGIAIWMFYSGQEPTYFMRSMASAKF